jgi:plasmid replication initiation protein
VSGKKIKELVVDNNAQYKMRNELVNSRYRLGVVEQRMIIALASHINKHGDDFDQCMIDANDLAKFMGLEPKSAYGQLKRTADALVKCIVSFEWYKTPKSKQKSWIKANWFDFIYYDAETVTIVFKFGCLVKPLLLEVVEAYVRAEAKPLMKFRRSASYRFYNFAVEWQKLREKTISIDDLKHMLMLDDEYPLYGGLNQKVIAPAIKEINNLTDYEISYMPKKTGRKITDIVFKIKVKNKSKIKPKKKDIETDALPAEWTKDQNDVYNELIALGIAKDASKQFVSNKPLEEIRININYAKEQKAAGKVKRMSAYLYQSINNDYGLNNARAAAQEAAAAAAKEQERIDAMSPKERESYLVKQDQKEQARQMATKDFAKQDNLVDNIKAIQTEKDAIKVEFLALDAECQKKYLCIVKEALLSEPNQFKFCYNRENYKALINGDLQQVLANEIELKQVIDYIYNSRHQNLMP